MTMNLCLCERRILMNTTNSENEGLFFSLSAEDNTQKIEEQLILHTETFFKNLQSGRANVQDLSKVAPLLDIEELMRGTVLLDKYQDIRPHFVQYYFARLIYKNANERRLSSTCKEAIKELCVSCCPSLLEELCAEQ